MRMRIVHSRITQTVPRILAITAGSPGDATAPDERDDRQRRSGGPTDLSGSYRPPALIHHVIPPLSDPLGPEASTHLRVR